jgi:hypothetical protein
MGKLQLREVRRRMVGQVTPLRRMQSDNMWRAATPPISTLHSEEIAHDDQEI